MKTQTLIEYGVYDVTAKSDSIPSATDKQEFVDINDLKKERITEVKYATLEKNYFVLNGKPKNMNGTETNMGWWSKSISNENGEFETPPTLVINFANENHSTLGLDLKFSQLDYPTHLKIQYYDEQDIMISEKEFYPDNYQYFCEDVVARYKKIIITFYSTSNPYRYVKMYSITYGTKVSFIGDNLISANILEETNLLSDELSINTLEFTVYTIEDQFNILNPQGIYRALQERQQLQVYKLANDEQLNMGAFYLDTWKNDREKMMSFTAIDLIGIIDKTTFMGNMYNNSTVETVINEIMTSAGLLQSNYKIDEELKNISVNGYIPICTHREALQQLLFSIGAVADCSRSDIIKIYRVVEEENPKVITKTNTFQGTTEIEQGELVTGVEVVSHNYKLNAEQENLYEGNVTTGTHTITFSEPVNNITCTNGTILQSGVNYVIIQTTSQADIVVKGYKYIDSTQNYISQVEGLNPTEKRNVLKIDSDYLINNLNAQEVANRVLSYYRNSYITRFDFILSNESTGENVSVEQKYENNLNGYVAKLDIDMTGGFIANAEIVAKVKEVANG